MSLVAPPHARAVTFSTISVCAVPGIAVFLPLIGAVSDAIGIQGSMLLIVPISVAGALVLASASGFVDDDIARVRRESVVTGAPRTRAEPSLPLHSCRAGSSEIPTVGRADPARSSVGGREGAATGA